MQNNNETPISRPQVISIVKAMLDKMPAPQKAWEAQIFEEMNSLKNVLESLRHDLGAVSVNDIHQEHVPAATDELDAVVMMTEDAANKIMNACDNIQKDMATMGEAEKAVLQTHMMQIFEACTFQDITSQRIAKVIKALKAVDSQVQQIMNILQAHYNDNAVLLQNERIEVLDARTGDAALLNGPQLPGEGVSQDEVDRILREMGAL